MNLKRCEGNYLCARLQGFTLVEMLIAMVLFLIVAGSIFNSCLFIFRSAEHNVYQLITHNIATGYLEQIKTKRSTEIFMALQDTSVPLKVKTAVATESGNVQVLDGSFLLNKIK